MAKLHDVEAVTEQIERMRVPGGWLYMRHRLSNNHDGMAHFVADVPVRYSAEVGNASTPSGPGVWRPVAVAVHGNSASQPRVLWECAVHEESDDGE